MHSAALLALTFSLAASDAYDTCVRADPVAQADALIAACAQAATEGDVAARVHALEVLGGAHAMLGRDEAASDAYLRMLLLSGSARLPADAGPRARRAFEIAKNRLLVDAPVRVQATQLDAQGTFELVVTDPLERVSALVLEGPDGTEQAIALESGDDDARRGNVSLAPWLPMGAKVIARVHGIGPDGGRVSAEPLATLELQPPGTRDTSLVRPVAGSVLLGAGTAGVLLGLGTFVTWWSGAQEAARAKAADEPLAACVGWCVGDDPYLFGVSGDDRKALEDGRAVEWMVAGAGVLATGLVLAGTGVLVLVSGDE
jgi:hypothetical protein